MTSVLVEEDARMPRAIRITLRSILGIVTLAGLLIGLWLIYKVFVAGGFFLVEGVFALVTLLLWNYGTWFLLNSIGRPMVIWFLCRKGMLIQVWD